MQLAFDLPPAAGRAVAERQAVAGTPLGWSGTTVTPAAVISISESGRVGTSTLTDVEIEVVGTVALFAARA